MNVHMSSDAATAAIFDQNSNDAAKVAVMKKALESEAQSAKALINAVPQPPKGSENLPPNLGRNVNTTA